MSQLSNPADNKGGDPYLQVYGPVLEAFAEVIRDVR